MLGSGAMPKKESTIVYRVPFLGFKWHKATPASKPVAVSVKEHITVRRRKPTKGEPAPYAIYHDGWGLQDFAMTLEQAKADAKAMAAHAAVKAIEMLE